jgi:hypothetical protein
LQGEAGGSRTLHQRHASSRALRRFLPGIPPVSLLSSRPIGPPSPTAPPSRLPHAPTLVCCSTALGSARVAETFLMAGSLLVLIQQMSSHRRNPHLRRQCRPASSPSALPHLCSSGGETSLGGWGSTGRGGGPLAGTRLGLRSSAARPCPSPIVTHSDSWRARPLGRPLLTELGLPKLTGCYATAAASASYLLALPLLRPAELCTSSAKHPPEEDEGGRVRDVLYLQIHDVLPRPRLLICHMRCATRILLPRRVYEHLGTYHQETGRRLHNSQVEGQAHAVGSAAWNCRTGLAALSLPRSLGETWTSKGKNPWAGKPPEPLWSSQFTFHTLRELSHKMAPTAPLTVSRPSKQVTDRA